MSPVQMMHGQKSDTWISVPNSRPVVNFCLVDFVVAGWGCDREENKVNVLMKVLI